MVFRADGKGEPTKSMEDITGFKHWFNKHCNQLKPAWEGINGLVDENTHPIFMKSCKDKYQSYMDSKLIKLDGDKAQVEEVAAEFVEEVKNDSEQK